MALQFTWLLVVNLIGCFVLLAALFLGQTPDLSFGFAANRAGVSNFEILNYNPQLSGQCMTGRMDLANNLTPDGIFLIARSVNAVIEIRNKRKEKYES